MKSKVARLVQRKRSASEVRRQQQQLSFLLGRDTSMGSDLRVAFERSID